MSSDEVTFSPSVRRFIFLLTVVAVLLIVANVVVEVLYLRFGIVHLDFFEEFLLGYEGNFPTYYSSMLLFLSFAFLWMAGKWSARRDDGNAKYWFLLAAAFLFLSVDEAASLHERLTQPMQKMGASGWLYFGWVIPAGVCVLLLGIVMIRFLARLEGRTRLLFVIAAILYLSGAIGLEMMGGEILSLRVP